MSAMSSPMNLGTEAHVVRAVAGDAGSLDWLVDRLTPLLLAQARMRIGRQLRVVIDEHDLVQEVWAIALPRLPSLREREGLSAGMLVAFLARILIYRCNDLVRKHIVGKPRPAGSSEGMLLRLPARHSGAVTRAVRRETQDVVQQAIARLDESDRQVVVMRGIERNPVAQIAAVMGLSENLVSVRYRRALDRLRGLLSADVVGMLASN
tara:strand:- start:251905 stop:252528 length:624 start_codon:yes stop_codon:yes gene_type:complete